MRHETQKILYKRQAEIFKAVAHPLRIAIVDLLNQGEQCVYSIATHVHADRSNVSRHLAVMVNAGILSYRKDGLRVMYRLETPCIPEFLDCIAQIIKNQFEQDKRRLRAV